MDRKVQNNCWGITAWALAGFALVVAAMLVFGGNGTEVAAVVTAS